MNASEPREDAVAVLLAACCEYFGPMDDPSICWVGRSPSHPDLFKCERCDAEHRDCAEIPHKPYCRAVKLRDALIAALAQQGAEPVAWVAFDAKGKPVNLEWYEETSRRRMPAGGSVAPLVQAAPATGAPR